MNLSTAVQELNSVKTNLKALKTSEKALTEEIKQELAGQGLEANITRLNTMIEELSRDNNSIDEIIESKYKLIEEVNKLKIEPYYSREEIISYIHTIIVEGNCLTISLNIGGEPLELPEQITF